jgi:hypothetical protein
MMQNQYHYTIAIANTFAKIQSYRKNRGFGEKFDVFKQF